MRKFTTAFFLLLLGALLVSFGLALLATQAQYDLWAVFYFTFSLFSGVAFIFAGVALLLWVFDQYICL